MRIVELGGRGLLVVAVAVLGLAAAAQATTVTIDGDLADWGVNLELYESGGTYNVNGHSGDYTRFLSSSFIPSSGIAYAVDNDEVPTAHGGELYDVEAMYATHDSDNAYFSVVTSADPNGTRWDGYGELRFGPGDLKLTIHNDVGVVYGVGARPIDLAQYGLISQIWGPLDQRDPATWDSKAGDGTYYTTSEARIEQEPTWSYVDNPGADIDAYFVADSGTLSGYAQAAWRQWSATGDYYEKDPYGKDEPYGTWILEMSVPLSALGLNESQHVGISYFALDCGNDALVIENLPIGPNAEPRPIPEPISMLFFGTGVAAVAGLIGRRRRKSRQARTLNTEY